MPVYQGELKDGRGRWLATMSILADDENQAARKLGLSSISFRDNFKLNDDDHTALRVCGRSICKMAEGVADFALTSRGKEGRVMWIPIGDYRTFRDAAICKAKEVESWG